MLSPKNQRRFGQFLMCIFFAFTIVCDVRRCSAQNNNRLEHNNNLVQNNYKDSQPQRFRQQTRQQQGYSNNGGGNNNLGGYGGGSGGYGGNPGNNNNFNNRLRNDGRVQQKPIAGGYGGYSGPNRPAPGVEFNNPSDSDFLDQPDASPKPQTPSRGFVTSTVSPLGLSQDIWDIRDAIPGQPRDDYPVLSKIPKTNFKCDGRIPGFYADPETRCQVFHRCNDCPGQPHIYQESFLCPNGTQFNQQILTCDWWANVECPTSEKFFDINLDIGAVNQDGSYVQLKTGRRTPEQKKVAPRIIPRDERQPLPPELRTIHKDGQHHKGAKFPAGVPANRNNNNNNQLPNNNNNQLPNAFPTRPSISTTRRPETITIPTVPPPPVQSFQSADNNNNNNNNNINFSDYFDDASLESRNNIPAILSRLQKYPENKSTGKQFINYQSGNQQGPSQASYTQAQNANNNNNNNQGNLPANTQPASFVVNRGTTRPFVQNQPILPRPDQPGRTLNSNQGVPNAPIENTIQFPRVPSVSPSPQFPVSRDINGDYGERVQNNNFETNNGYQDLSGRSNFLSNDVAPQNSNYVPPNDLNRYVTAPPPIQNSKDSYQPIPDSHYRLPSIGYQPPPTTYRPFPAPSFAPPNSQPYTAPPRLNSRQRPPGQNQGRRNSNYQSAPINFESPVASASDQRSKTVLAQNTLLQRASYGEAPLESPSYGEAPART